MTWTYGLCSLNFSLNSLIVEKVLVGKLERFSSFSFTFCIFLFSFDCKTKISKSKNFKKFLFFSFLFFLALGYKPKMVILDKQAKNIFLNLKIKERKNIFSISPRITNDK